jgi:hypothetical protein
MATIPPSAAADPVTNKDNKHATDVQFLLFLKDFGSRTITELGLNCGAAVPKYRKLHTILKSVLYDSE